MRDFVLDCSVTMAWCFEDEADSKSDLILDSLRSRSALVPELWYSEIANVLVQCERNSRLTEAQSSAFLHRLSQLPIRRLAIPHEEYFSDVLHLARRWSLTSYDATYLHLALREGAQLATRDSALISSAKRMGVDLI